MPNISGAIAAIVNEREVVLNFGTTKGARLGQRFRILDQMSEVRDPVTKEILGSIRREKIRVKIVELQERMSIARTFETYEVNVGGSGSYDLSVLKGMFAPKQIVTRVRTLRYEDSGLQYEPLDETGSFVKVGDVVEQIDEEGDDAVSERATTAQSAAAALGRMAGASIHPSGPPPAGVLPVPPPPSK